MARGQAGVIDRLRTQIRALEGIGAPAGAAVLSLDIEAIDTALPDGGLPLGCVHEVTGASGMGARGGGGAATGFCAALSARIVSARGGGAVLWLQRGGDLYMPGLARYGLHPGSVITVRDLGRGRDMLWAFEEALRCNALVAVVAEVAEADRIGLTASRRLQLAAEGAGITGFLLCESELSGSSAAVTRWRLSNLPSTGPSEIGPREPNSEPGVGAPCWKAELLRCRGGRPAVWSIGWRGSAWHSIEAEASIGAEARRLAG